MPSSDGTSPSVADEEMANSVLNRFLSVPEQTYEEFLSTFTCPPKAHCHLLLLGTDRHHSQVMFKGSKIQKTQTTPGTQEKKNVTIVPEEPEQLMIDEGTTVGHCHSLNYSGRVQVDNYFNSSDIDTDSDNGETSPSVLLYPGEVDLELAGEEKPIVRNTCLQSHTSSGAESMAEEHLSDEIRPFSLDQSFDYDRVALTSKLSEEELNFLRLREPRKTEETETGRET
ncbi:intraflagellar transport-associated protein isoform X2 [Dendropsophus ebraccatus]